MASGEEGDDCGFTEGKGGLLKLFARWIRPGRFKAFSWQELGAFWLRLRRGVHCVLRCKRIAKVESCATIEICGLALTRFVPPQGEALDFEGCKDFAIACYALCLVLANSEGDGKNRVISIVLDKHLPVNGA